MQPLVQATVDRGTASSTPHSGLGLGASFAAAAQGRRRRLLVTNLVSTLVIGTAFGIAVYLHEAAERKEKDKIRKIVLIQQKAKPPEPPKPPPPPPPPLKKKPGPKDPGLPKKQRLKAPDREVTKAIKAPDKVPDKAEKPPEQVEDDSVHMSTDGTDDESAGEVGGGVDAPPPGPTGSGGGSGDGTPVQPEPPPPPPKKKPKPPTPIFLRAGMPSPERISGDDPAFPPAAQQAGIDGTVVLLITVGTDGKVKDVKIIKNLPIIGEHCARVVKSWRYAPYIYQGQPAPIIVRQPFSFKLSK